MAAASFLPLDLARGGNWRAGRKDSVPAGMVGPLRREGGEAVVVDWVHLGVEKPSRK